MNIKGIALFYGLVYDEFIVRLRITTSPILVALTQKLEVSRSLSVPAELSKIAQRYSEAWDKSSDMIVKSLEETTGLSYVQNIIDAYVVPGFIPPTSNPIILGDVYNPEHAVDILTHELIHRLLSDNTLREDFSEIDSLSKESESDLMRKHILVHAIHSYLYLDVLKNKERLERDKEISSKIPDYKKAWDIVEIRGYQSIIDSLNTAIKKPR